MIKVLGILFLLEISGCQVPSSEVDTSISDVANVKTALAPQYSQSDSAESVTRDLGLPTKGDAGVSISWLSSNPAIVSPVGTVVRPAPGSENVRIVLTATLLKAPHGKESKTFELIVKALPASTDADLLSLSLSGISLNPPFSPETLSYSATLESGISTLTVNGLSQSPTAKVDGTGIHQIPYGTTTLTVKVEAQDRLTTRAYTIAVTRLLPSSEKSLLSFGLALPRLDAVVDESQHTVELTVPYSTDLTSLVPQVTFTGLTIEPSPGSKVDFTKPVNYLITAQDQSQQQYTVSIHRSFLVDEVVLMRQISMAKWLNGATSALSLTFDDNNLIHQKISQLLDNYRFLGTFFINPGSGPNYKMYKEIASRGHEIGSHTMTHPKLPTVTDPAVLKAQLSDPIQKILQNIGTSCVSFAHPHNLTSAEVDEAVFQYYPFTRISSPYGVAERIISNIESITTTDQLRLDNDRARKDGKWMILAGHGIDGYGWSPVSSEFLLNFLDYVKSFGDQIWEGTMGQVGAYERLRQELDIVTSVDETLGSFAVGVRGFDADRYAGLPSLPITIDVPTADATINLTLFGGNSRLDAVLKKTEFGYRLTYDLKSGPSVQLILTR